MESQLKDRVQRRRNHQPVVTIQRLRTTYLCPDTGTLPTRESAESLDAVLSSVLSKETLDQLSNRICCYALTQAKGLHLGGIIQHTVQANDLSTKVRHARERGHRWDEIITWVSQNLPYQLTGIIVVLGKRSLWERAKPHAWRAALADLSKNTDIIEQARQSTPTVDTILRHIRDTLFSGLTVAMSNPDSGPNFVRKVTATRVNSSSTMRSYHTESANSQREVASMAAKSGLQLEQIDADAALLLVLLCFLGDSLLPLSLLSRGTTPRKRWNDMGGIEDADGLQLGLSSELVSICSSPTQLSGILDQLESFSAISKISDHSFKLDKSLAVAIISRIPIEFHPFWRLQALIIACRSIPWKYLEHPPSNIDLFLSHIRHTLQEAQNHGTLENMSPAIKSDLALSIMEASRFPGMDWKRFAVSQSKLFVSDVQDDYIQSCIAQRESLLNRITGSKGQSLQPLEINQHATVPGRISKRLHSGSGHSAIQRALDHIQAEELSKAAEVLAAWEPISSPSLMELVVLFRKHVMMGKIERYRGNFKKSLEHLMESTDIVNEHKDIVFLEDSSDLVCSLADTYLELEDAVAAERCLREEIAQQTHSVTLLKLALAESLFAQNRHFDAEIICNEVGRLPKLLKMERLRLSIILAKLAHVNAKYNEALVHWTDAMAAISRYTLANGHATRIILLSTYDVLRQVGDMDTLMKFQSQWRTHEQLKIVEDLAKPEGFFYWIGGLRHWLKYLESINRSRI